MGPRAKVSKIGASRPEQIWGTKQGEKKKKTGVVIHSRGVQRLHKVWERNNIFPEKRERIAAPSVGRMAAAWGALVTPPFSGGVGLLPTRRGGKDYATQVFSKERDGEESAQKGVKGGGQ